MPVPLPITWKGVRQYNLTLSMSRTFHYPSKNCLVCFFANQFTSIPQTSGEPLSIFTSTRMTFMAPYAQAKPFRRCVQFFERPLPPICCHRHICRDEQSSIFAVCRNAKVVRSGCRPAGRLRLYDFIFCSGPMTTIWLSCVPGFNPGSNSLGALPEILAVPGHPRLL